MALEVWLVRHGCTTWNEERRWQGHTDIPLNAKGHRQALDIAQYLKTLHDAHTPFDIVLTR
jgi:broad specificity phosphatase PhoE